eukprot:Skav227213  [mRNA]  locus=scaffold2048:364147:365493:- [translate_table: standard]
MCSVPQNGKTMKLRIMLQMCFPDIRFQTEACSTFFQVFQSFSMFFSSPFARVGDHPEVTCSLLAQEVLPKSHLSGALQRVLGRDVFKDEMPFFYRTTETKDFYFCLLRLPALPKKNPDGSNYIPARPFHYYSGRGPTLEEAEQDAARKALVVIRKADSETARWLSWSASTSKQALEIAAANLADARPTDGQARSRLNRALAVLHNRTIKSHEVRYFVKDDPDSCHVVLRLPWKQSRLYYFEGSGLTSLLAKESAAEAALKILRPLVSNSTELPWQRNKQQRNTTQTPQEAARDKNVPAKVRLFQFLEAIMKRDGRTLDRKDLIYSCRPVLDGEPESEDVKIWESNLTEVMLQVPPLDPDGEDLRFSKRMPSWRKPPPADSEYFRNKHKKKHFYQMKAEARKSFLDAQQAVADVAVEELLELLPGDFFDSKTDVNGDSIEETMLEPMES